MLRSSGGHTLEWGISDGGSKRTCLLAFSWSFLGFHWKEEKMQKYQLEIKCDCQNQAMQEFLVK
jgi:hypothetical protein